MLGHLIDAIKMYNFTLEIQDSVLSLKKWLKRNVRQLTNDVLCFRTCCFSPAHANSIGLSVQCLMGKRRISTLNSAAASLVLNFLGGRLRKANSNNCDFFIESWNLTLCWSNHFSIWTLHHDRLGGLASSHNSLCQVALSITIQIRIGSG